MLNFKVWCGSKKKANLLLIFFSLLKHVMDLFLLEVFLLITVNQNFINRKRKDVWWNNLSIHSVYLSFVTQECFSVTCYVFSNFWIFQFHIISHIGINHWNSSLSSFIGPESLSSFFESKLNYSKYIEEDSDVISLWCSIKFLEWWC